MKYHPKVQDIPTNLINSIFLVIVKSFYSKINLSGAHQSNKKFAPFLPTTIMEAKILNNPTFYRRIYRLNYDHEVFNGILVHYCFDDPFYTVLVCDLLLQQMNKGDQGNLPLLIRVKFILFRNCQAS